MPAKRKIVTKEATDQNKRVCTGTSSVTDEPEVTASGRPKRKSVRQPQYNFTKKTSTSTQIDTQANLNKAHQNPSRKGNNTSSRKSTATSSVGRPGTQQNLSSLPNESTRAQKGKTNVKDEPDPSVSKKSATKTKEPAPKGTKVRVSRSSNPLPRRAGQTLVSVDIYTGAGTDDDQESDQEETDAQYWLMKAEPNDRFENGHNVKFSIDDLAAAKEPEPWDGVRNYVARNNMRAMRKGDLAFFYHSNCTVPAIVGVMRVVQEHSVDESAFNSEHPYYDEKSTREKPKWDVVHVQFVKKFDQQITLKMMNNNAAETGELADMQVLTTKRLSVTKVRPREWRFILDMAGEDRELGAKE